MAEIGKYDRTPVAERLTVVIPAYNEQAGLGNSIQSLMNEPRLSGARILVIDDGSTDQTSEIGQQQGAEVVRNKINLGYGGSLKRGIRLATTEFVAWFDADGQHSAEDLADMLDQIDAEQADAVIGARSATSHVARTRAFGKKVIHLSAEIAIGQRIPDVNCGLRVFRRTVIERYLHLLPNGFSASTTSTLLFIQRNCHLMFHTVHVSERVGTSTVRQIRDGLRTLHTILRILILFNALRTFSVLASVFVGTGLIYGLSMALVLGAGFPVLAALAVMLGIQIFCLGVLCDQISAMRLERLEPRAVESTDEHESQPLRIAA